jgi:DNA-binding NarL/FixJ family response regulator
LSARQDLTFVIADEHELYRDALKITLEEQGFRVLGAAPDGKATVRLCQKLRPDIVVLDLTMPLLDGVATVRAIKSICPGTGIIFLTARGERSYVLAGLRAGAAGYVTKTSSGSTLAEAIDAVVKGAIYVSADAVQSCSAPVMEKSSQARSLFHNYFSKTFRNFRQGRGENSAHS